MDLAVARERDPEGDLEERADEVGRGALMAAR